MAHQIEAIAAYCPQIEQGSRATQERYMALTTSRTTLSPGVVKNVQEAEVETLIGLLAEGRPVYTGTAVYRPSIDLNGRIRVQVQVDRRILRMLNAEGVFEGSILNEENIGKSSEELVALWNETHPGDPVTP